MDFIKENEELRIEGYKRMEELTKEHEDRMLAIQSKGKDSIQKMVDAFRARDFKSATAYMADSVAGIAQHSRKAFEISKAAGIANAVVSAYKGIALTLSEYPYPLSIAMAAAQAAVAFAQVKAISSQSFGKTGGAAPSLAGGTPAPPVTPVTGGIGPSGSGGRLIVEGIDPSALFSGRAVRELMERIAEHQRDGGTVVFG